MALCTYLRHPNEEFLRCTWVPLAERNPLLMWKCISLVLAVVLLALLAASG